MGVIANLSLRFALHTLFADSERVRRGHSSNRHTPMGKHPVADDLYRLGSIDSHPEIRAGHHENNVLFLSARLGGLRVFLLTFLAA